MFSIYDKHRTGKAICDFGKPDDYSAWLDVAVRKPHALSRRTEKFIRRLGLPDKKNK